MKRKRKEKIKTIGRTDYNKERIRTEGEISS